jgi:hypothetical protein
METVMKSLLPERKDFWRKTIKNFFSKNWERKSDETRLFNLVLRGTHYHALPLFHGVIKVFFLNFSTFLQNFVN